MRIKFLSLLAFAGLLGLATACTDKNLPNPGNEENHQTTAEKGYIGFRIGLQSQTGSRAGETYNEVYEDGLSAEYAIKDGILLVFTKTTETQADAEATFVGAFQMESIGAMIADGNRLVTGYSPIVLPTSVVNGTNVAYGYAILNTNNLLQIGADGSLQAKTGGVFKTTLAGDSYVAAGGVLLAAGNTPSTFATLQGIVLDGLSNASSLTTTGFLMTSTPFSSTTGAEGYAGKVSTLEKIDKEQVYPTIAEAQAGSPAAILSVERAMTKVTFNVTSPTNAIKPATAQLDGEETEAQAYTIGAANVRYIIDQTSKSQYFTRNVIGVNTENGITGWGALKADNVTDPSAITMGYRFISRTAFNTESGPAGNDHYRIRWANTTQYATEYDAANYHTLAVADSASVNGTVNTPQYSLENTFDVAHMVKNRTTRVIVAVDFNGKADAAANADLYSFGANRLFELQSFKNALANRIAALPKIQNLKRNGYSAAVKASDIFVNASNNVNDGAITLDIDGETGKVTVSDLAFALNAQSNGGSEGKPFAFGTTISDNDKTEIINEINRTLMSRLKNGIAYYPVYIQHFDNVNETNKPGSTSGDLYGVDAANSNELKNAMNAKYLGRYGVVRNHWYDLTLNKIDKVGEPVIPTSDTTYDDASTQYLQLRLRIMAWDKHSQSVDL